MAILPTDVRATAFAIARVRAEEAKIPAAEQLFTDPYAELFLDGSSEAPSGALESIPFFREQVRLRTRFFDESLKAALLGGARTIALVGAGLDTRAIRLPEIAQSGATVIELDLPGQLEEKWRRLANAGVARPDYVECASLDLGSTNFDAPLGLAFQARASHQPIFWLCEGLLGYLEEAQLSQLAAATFRLSRPGSRLEANYYCPVWSADVIHHLLESRGWRSTQGPSFATLHRRWVAEDVPPGSERFALLAATR